VRSNELSSSAGFTGFIWVNSVLFTSSSLLYVVSNKLSYIVSTTNPTPRPL